MSILQRAALEWERFLKESGRREALMSDISPLQAEGYIIERREQGFHSSSASISDSCAAGSASRCMRRVRSVSRTYSHLSPDRQTTWKRMGDFVYTMHLNTPAVAIVLQNVLNYFTAPSPGIPAVAPGIVLAPDQACPSEC